MSVKLYRSFVLKHFCNAGVRIFDSLSRYSVILADGKRFIPLTDHVITSQKTKVSMDGGSYFLAPYHLGEFIEVLATEFSATVKDEDKIADDQLDFMHLYRDYNLGDDSEGRYDAELVNLQVMLTELESIGVLELK